MFHKRFARFTGSDFFVVPRPFVVGYLTYSFALIAYMTSKHHLPLLPSPSSTPTFLKPKAMFENPKILLAPDISCGSVQVVVHSAVRNYAHRGAFRHMVAAQSTTDNFDVAFIVALSKSHQENDAVQREFHTHRDVVVVDFVDSYRNNSLKHLAWMVWLSKSPCISTFVVKVDDDAYVNFQGVDRFINVYRLNVQTPFIAGYINTEAPVARDPRKKWKVDANEYSGNFYPPYAYGLAYITNLHSIKKLLEHAYTIPLFWIDDVHIGILAASADVPFVTLNRKICMSLPCRERDIMFVHMPVKEPL